MDKIDWFRGRPGTAFLLACQVIGQLGILLAIPILTRAFTPEEMGRYQLANAIALIVQPVSTLRHEFIIPTAISHGGVKRYFCRGMMSTALLSGGAVVIGFALSAMGHGDSAETLFMMAALVLAYSWTTLDNAVLIHAGRRKKLAIRNLSTGVLGGSLQVAAALLGAGIVAVAIAVLVGRALTICVTRISTPLRNDEPEERSQYGAGRVLLTVLTGIISNASLNVLPIAVSVAGSTASVGYVGVAQRAAGAPMSFLGMALGQLVQGAIASGIRRREPGTREAVVRYIRTALPVGLVISGLMAALGPVMAVPLLGPGWDSVGILIAILALPFSLQLVVNPLNPVFVMLGYENLLFRIQCFRLLVAGGGSFIAAIMVPDLYLVSGYYAVSTLAVYAVTLVRTVEVARLFDRSLELGEGSRDDEQ